LDTQVQKIESEADHFLGKKEPALLAAITDFLQPLLKSVQTSQVNDGDESDETIRYTDKYYCAKDDIKYPELTPAHFSSNRQEGACEKCH